MKVEAGNQISTNRIDHLLLTGRRGTSGSNHRSYDLIAYFSGLRDYEVGNHPMRTHVSVQRLTR